LSQARRLRYVAPVEDCARPSDIAMGLPIDIKAVLAEFLAMTLFVFFCCGSATGVANTPGWVQQVSLTFGICITVLAYGIGHYSGGHINGAVTLGLCVAGVCPPLQGVANFVAQIMGSLLGAALLALCVHKTEDLTGTYGTNTLNPNYEWYQAFIGEVLGTFFLMFTVLQTAVSEKSKGNRMMAAVAIGFCVYLAHSILIPIDGCSINPTRSFGPAVVASIAYSGNDAKTHNFWKYHYIFWLGPIIGSLLGVGVYKLMEKIPDKEASETGPTDAKGCV